jgi:hypothetical protein
MYEVRKMGRLYKLSVKILLDLFECIFNNIAMEIHNIHDSALFNEENVIAQSSTVDTSETDPKQMLSHSMTTDTLTGSVVYTSAIEIRCGFNTPMHSSTPRTRFANNQSCYHDNTLIRSLLSEVECLKEQCNQLSFQLAEIKNKSVVTVSTQTYECVKLSKHTQTIKVEKKVGASQTMNNSEGSVSSIATKKTALGSKSANVSTSQVKMNKTQTKSNTEIKPPQIAKTLIVGSSILQKISTRGLSRHTTVKTYRGTNTSHIRYRLEKSQ